MIAKDLDEQLRTIAVRAKELRDAGVVGRITVGDVSFELVVAEPHEPAQSDGHEKNPLDDPDTYGGHIPNPRWSQRSSEDLDEE